MELLITPDSIQYALISSPYRYDKGDYFWASPTLSAIIEKAIALGYVCRMSYTQAEWTRKGIQWTEQSFGRL